MNNPWLEIPLPDYEGHMRSWGDKTMYGLDFGESQRVVTRQGTVYMREAAPTEQFWNAWRHNKDEVKAKGLSLRKYHDEWIVSYWSDTEDCPLPKPFA